MIPKQGAIYLVDLDPTKGHEQSGKRPVLVLQNNVLNKNLSTIVIAPLTSNLKLKGTLTSYFLSSEICGLQKDSVILLFQVRTIDKSRLEKYVGTLSETDFNDVKKQLSYVF